eukprot:NODE_6425_length_454_cov_116.920988_g4889_i0.p2 GENE.NODE_6425_length_454_cov_116.920988_g4889_i0~~NODE_6425_length_454_cov_116.920988_g4889_i0.p2  ORF type:complete len:71 (-),score=46.20 NODE_6425_length_454_cov_116.920988_g4889_i0:241-423(-)
MGLVLTNQGIPAAAIQRAQTALQAHLAEKSEQLAQANASLALQQEENAGRRKKSYSPAPR